MKVLNSILFLVFMGYYSYALPNDLVNKNGKIPIETQFLNPPDIDGDGVPDDLDKCVFTIEADVPSLYTENNPNSPRYGCPIVPSSITGSNKLLVNNYITGNEVMVSKDRSCFFSVRGGTFRTYDAKYYYTVINSPLDSIKNIPFINDMVAELGYDAENSLMNDGDDPGYGEVFDNHIIYDPNNYNATHKFELYYTQEDKGGVKLKQNDKTFGYMLGGLLENDSSLLLTNMESCNLFLKDDENIYGYNIESIDLPRGTRMLKSTEDVGILNKPIDEFNLEENNIKTGAIEQIPIPYLTKNEGIGFIELEGDPLSDENDGKRPKIKTLLSENSLYKFGLPGYYLYYNTVPYKKISIYYGMPEALATGLIGGALIVGGSVFAAGEIAAIAAEEALFIESVDAAAVIEEEVAEAQYALQGLDVSQGTLQLNQAREELQAASNALKAANEYLARQRIILENARIAIPPPTAEYLTQLESIITVGEDQVELLSVQFVQAEEEMEYAQEAYEILEESEPAQEEAAEELANKTRIRERLKQELEKGLEDLRTARNNIEKSVESLIDRKNMLPTLRTFKDYGRLTTLPFIAINALISAGKGAFSLTVANRSKKHQSVDAILSRNFPRYILQDNTDYIEAVNMIEPIAPSLDQPLNFNDIFKIVFWSNREVGKEKLETVPQDIEDDKRYVDYWEPTLPDRLLPIPTLPQVYAFEIFKDFEYNFCPSYTASFINGDFKLIRTEYYFRKSKGNDCNKKVFRTPPPHYERIINSNTAGIGEKTEVSNFGNLVVKDAQSCTIWDIFSTELNRPFPDLNKVILNDFLLPNYRRKFLIQSNIFVPPDFQPDFSNDLKAGEGLVPSGDISDGAFILMENGKSALFNEGITTTNDFRIPINGLLVKWQKTDQTLGSARNIVLSAEGQLITYNCSEAIVSTIPSPIDDIQLNGFRNKYGDIFVGTDYVGDGGYNVAVDFMMFAGSGIGNSSVGLPIGTYTGNNNFNPFPIFTATGKSILTVSNQKMSLDDFYISADQRALVRYMPGIGIALYTRTNISDRKKWNYVRTLLNQGNIDLNRHTFINIIHELGLPNLIENTQVELQGDGSALLVNLDLPYTSDIVDSNEMIGGLFNSVAQNNIKYKYLMSQNRECIATTSNDKIIIYKSSNGIFNINGESVVSTFGLTSEYDFQTPITNASVFYVDNRGSIKFLSNDTNKYLLFESKNNLTYDILVSQNEPVKSQFKLQLSNTCELNVQKNSPPLNTFINYQTYSATSFSTTSDYNGFQPSFGVTQNSIKIDQLDQYLFIKEGVTARDISLYGTQIPYISVAIDGNYCRSSVLNGVFYLENTYTGDIIWTLPNHDLTFDPTWIRYATLSDQPQGGFYLLDFYSTSNTIAFYSTEYNLGNVINREFTSHSLFVGGYINEANQKFCEIRYGKLIGGIFISEWISADHPHRRLIQELDYLNVGQTLGPYQKLVSPDGRFKATLDESNENKIKVSPNDGADPIYR